MWRVVMARLSIPPSPCRGELDWLWGPTCTRAERGRAGREGLGAWALVGEDAKSMFARLRGMRRRACRQRGAAHAALVGRPCWLEARRALEHAHPNV